MRQYTGNRIGLALVGAILLGVGAYTYLRGLGRLPTQAKGAPLLDARLGDYVSGHPWVAWVAALALVMLAMVALRWLLLALGWGRLGSRTGIGTAQLCDGLSDIDGISHAKVRVVGEERLRLTVSCPPDADVGALVGKLDGEVVDRVRREVGDELSAIVRVHVRRS